MLTTALTSGYILWMYKRIFYGTVPETLKNVRESSRYVIVTMGVIAAFTLVLGVYPDLFYKPIINYVEDLYSNSTEDCTNTPKSIHTGNKSFRTN